MQYKGVIVAAGYGTRFLPATKTVPKELLPLLDRPAIDFVLEEFVQAGLAEILVISSRRKKALEDYFDREYELASELEKGQSPLAGKAQAVKPRIFTTRQQAMNGTGNALLLAKPFLGSSPCVVAYPDDLFLGGSLAAELMACHAATGGSILALADRSGEDVSRFGVAAVAQDPVGLRVKGFVEKPQHGSEPSALVSLGRYLFEAEFFQDLAEGLAHHRGGEYYHLGAMNRAAAEGRLWGHVSSLEHLDVGEPLGYLQAFCRYATCHPVWGERAKELLTDGAWRPVNLPPGPTP
jgi:UTP--glucose-1-phosphate uridylyltransferase